MKRIAICIVLALALPGQASAGDVAAGEKVFKKCQACHEVGADAKTKVGPILNGVFGRTAGTMSGYDGKYSKTMIEAGQGGLIWTPETMAQYIESPKDFIKKNKMSFVGVKKPEERDDVIAYLLQFSPDYQPAN